MIVAVAGRRIDARAATQIRFPLAARQLVQRRIAASLERLGASAVVTSAACGADLLALHAAARLHLRRRIILPYAEDAFAADSVLDRPGRWLADYRAACEAARAAGDLLLLDEPRGTERAFRAATDAIVAEALALARQASPRRPKAALAALVIWDGAPRGPDDMTAYFKDRMTKAEARVVEVSTLPHAVAAYSSALAALQS